ncbi:MAG: phosphomannomutase, partial [Candidatus Curtissbacteria bacterium]|nr:phosphomannomutase [Candidatus Curtissbacteria bacterium]
MPEINPLIFRAYDIRGIAAPLDDKPADLTEETVYLIGKGTGTYLKRKYNTASMAVGCDNRLTGPTLKAAFIKGITESGIEAIDVGIAISPMIYWASCAMPFDSATNITASHNPQEYNGVKTVTKDAHSICGDELQEILKLIQNQDFINGSTPAGKREEDIWPKYLNDLLSKVKVQKPLKVVVDAGNGTAGKFAPEFLEKLGCEVVPLYCDLDGTFPNHEANPEELKNMLDLIEKVKEEKADLGIGFDGDGDRVGVVDETGHLYS